MIEKGGRPVERNRAWKTKKEGGGETSELFLLATRESPNKMIYICSSLGKGNNIRENTHKRGGGRESGLG